MKSIAGRVLFLWAAFTAGALSAARELTLGDYTAEVRSRVVASVRQALDPGGHVTEVGGTVTFADEEGFFLQKDDDAIKVLFASGDSPAAGDAVIVEGAPSLEGGRVVFAADRVRRTAASRLPEPRSVGADALICGNVSNSVNWLRVQLTGRVIGRTERGFAMDVDDVPVNVVVAALPADFSDCDETHPRVRVVGVVELILDQSALLRKSAYVMGVRLNVASPADLELVPDTAYLLAKRERVVRVVAATLVITLALTLLLLAFVIFRQRRRLFRSRTIMAERKRMADDIHDTIEQHLVGAGMLLQLNRLKEAQDVLVRAKREIRDIVWGLKNDDMMRLSPADMIRQLAHEETTRGLFRVETRLEGLPEHVDAAFMRDLSLIVREAIGNAVKHGGAKKIAISSDPLPSGGWMLRIANDGRPFDPASAPGAAEGHFGLDGMRQRARRLGATVSFAPRGDGMVVTVCREGVST